MNKPSIIIKEFIAANYKLQFTLIYSGAPEWCIHSYTFTILSLYNCPSSIVYKYPNCLFLTYNQLISFQIAQANYLKVLLKHP